MFYTAIAVRILLRAACVPSTCAPDLKRLTCVNHIKGPVSEAGQKGALARVCGWIRGDGAQVLTLLLLGTGHSGCNLMPKAVALFTRLLSPLYLQAGPQQKLPEC